jgi:hypothetical protein
MNNYSPKLSAVGGGPAVSGVVGRALATGSGDFALGGESFAIFVSSLFGFWFLALAVFFAELLSVALWFRWYSWLCWLCWLCWLFCLLYESSRRGTPIPPTPMPNLNWAFAV